MARQTKSLFHPAACLPHLEEYFKYLELKKKKGGAQETGTLKKCIYSISPPTLLAPFNESNKTMMVFILFF